MGCREWGCNRWGFKGCLAALSGNRPKSAFFALFLPFSPFSGGPEEHLENPMRKKAFFLRYPRISLNPHLLNPHLRHPNLCLCAFSGLEIMLLIRGQFANRTRSIQSLGLANQRWELHLRSHIWSQCQDQVSRTAILNCDAIQKKILVSVP